MHRSLSRKCFLGSASLAAGFGNATAAESYTLRLSTDQPATGLLGAAAIRFATEVGRRSKGQLKVEVYASGQLLKEQESIDALTVGNVDFVIISASFLERLFPQFQVLALPFLFKDSTTAFRVVDGPVGDSLFAQLEAKGIRGLAWGTSGRKEMVTVSKPVATPSDMKGLRIRILNSSVYVATYQSLGAIPVVTDSSELYLALSQHTVDGMDTSLDAFASQNLYTVAKHMAVTNHVYTVNPLLGSRSKIEGLPLALQKVVKEAGRAVVPYWRTLQAQNILDSMETLKKNGVAFTQPSFAAFRKAVDPVYALVQTKIGGDLIDRIGRAAG